MIFKYRRKSKNGKYEQINLESTGIDKQKKIGELFYSIDVGQMLNSVDVDFNN